MSSKIFVGNLPFSIDNAKLESAFIPFGSVASAKVIHDKNTGRSRGYGFVEFVESSSANKAVAEMNDKELDGRKLTVSIAKTQS